MKKPNPLPNLENGFGFCVMETAVLSPVPQPFDGFLALVVGKIAGVFTSTHYGRVQQTGSCIIIYLYLFLKK